MGSGKTSLGKKLARQMHVPFFDLDQEIEKELQKSISRIFQEEGEEFFRKKETQSLSRLINENEKFVLSCGGGTPCFNKNMSLMNSAGTSIFLDVDQDLLLGRLKKNKIKRPLISTLDDHKLKDFVEEKLLERRAFYLQSLYVLKQNNPTVSQVLELMGSSGWERGSI